MSAAENRHESRIDIAIAVVEYNGQYLIGLRPEGVALAGYWEFPGGKVKPGEFHQAAVVRECLEETGLAVRITGELLSAEHDYTHARVRLLFFACEPVGQPTPVPPRFRWVLAEDLGRYTFPPANAQLVAELIQRQSD